MNFRFALSKSFDFALIIWIYIYKGNIHQGRGYTGDIERLRKDSGIDHSLLDQSVLPTGQMFPDKYSLVPGEPKFYC